MIAVACEMSVKILFCKLNLPGFIYLGLSKSNAGLSQEVQNTGQYLSFSCLV